MDGTELRRRLDQLRRPYTELAPLLGLSASGLHKQMNGQTAVSRQTELCLEQLELLVELTRDMTTAQKCAVVENAMRKFEHRETARSILRDRRPKAGPDA
jgi:hypothetical protein